MPGTTAARRKGRMFPLVLGTDCAGFLVQGDRSEKTSDPFAFLLKPITMHWSGCPTACGNHLVADIGLLGKKAKVDGKVVDAVDVYVGGRSGPDPKLAVKIYGRCALRQVAYGAGRTGALSHERKNHRVGAAGRPNDRPLKSAPRRTRPDVSPLEPREGVRYPPVYNSGGT